MSENFNSFESSYYAVNDRPVKMISTPDGGMDVLVMNLKTGKFESDISYLSRCYNPDQDVDEFSEQTFNQYVEQLRREIAKKNNRRDIDVK